MGKDFTVILAVSFLLSRPKISILGKSVEINCLPSALPSPLPGLHASPCPQNVRWPDPQPSPSSLAAESFVPGRRQTYFEIANVVDVSLCWTDTKCLLSAGWWCLRGDISSFLSKVDMGFSSFAETFAVNSVPWYLGDRLEQSHCSRSLSYCYCGYFYCSY